MRKGAVAIAMAFAAARVGSAADWRYPDWPCNQLKVPELSAAAVWTGPSIEDVGSAWENDPQIRDLVAYVAARRTPIEEAEKAITDFLAADSGHKEARAKLLFASVFGALNRERSVVIGGIERFSRLQRAFAEKIRAEVNEIRQMQDAPVPDQAKLAELTNIVNWDIRAFEEKRKTIGYTCEVPVLIEQRLFALARIIQQQLE
jgi:hypothetical protein